MWESSRNCYGYDDPINGNFSHTLDTLKDKYVAINYIEVDNVSGTLTNAQMATLFNSKATVIVVKGEMFRLMSTSDTTYSYFNISKTPEEKQAITQLTVDLNSGNYESKVLIDAITRIYQSSATGVDENNEIPKSTVKAKIIATGDIIILANGEIRTLRKIKDYTYTLTNPVASFLPQDKIESNILPNDGSNVPKVEIEQLDTGGISLNFKLPNGPGLRLAKYDVRSNSDVKLSDISNPDNIQLGDILIDTNGDSYLIVKVDKDKVHVGDYLKDVQGNTITFKGPQGEKGKDASTPDLQVDDDGYLKFNLIGK